MATSISIQPIQTSLRALETSQGYIAIERLRFPQYKNIERDETLNFEFPVTALLGTNGTNKSSILHALWGAPKRNTTADFWFETALDAIPSLTDGLKQSVVHSYRKGSELVDCIKSRAPRGESDPDYWEAVKPTKQYGFTASQKRVPPIEIEVLYVDFRAALPAFDKYFHFPNRQHLGQLRRRAREAGALRREYRKQDYLRRRSPHVRRELEAAGAQMRDDEIDALRHILGRDYRAGVMLEHSQYHGHVGRTVLFKVDHIAGGYSDAFAGSGESAVAFIVHDLLRAKEKSLVLLDEPETSLHPRAQSKLLEFLCSTALQRKLQIVMSTHSIHLASALPQKAIRVLYTGEGGKIRISSSHTAAEAMHEIADIPPGRTCLVEDVRAKVLLEASLQAAGGAVQKDIRVVVRAGGTSRIFADMRAFSVSGRTDITVLLDGDHALQRAIPASGALPQGLQELESLIGELTRGPNEAGPKMDFTSAGEATAYIEFLRRHLKFLPGENPEQFVWDDDVCRRLFFIEPQSLSTIENYKDRIHRVAQESIGHDDDTVFRSFVAALFGARSPKQEQLLDIVAEVRTS